MTTITASHGQADVQSTLRAAGVSDDPAPIEEQVQALQSDHKVLQEEVAAAASVVSSLKEEMEVTFCDFL